MYGRKAHRRDCLEGSLREKLDTQEGRAKGLINKNHSIVLSVLAREPARLSTLWETLYIFGFEGDGRRDTLVWTDLTISLPSKSLSLLHSVWEGAILVKHVQLSLFNSYLFCIYIDESLLEIGFTVSYLPILRMVITFILWIQLIFAVHFSVSIYINFLLHGLFFSFWRIVYLNLNIIHFFNLKRWFFAFNKKYSV